MRKLSLFLGVLTVCLSEAPAAPDWQPVATELLRTEKTGFGGLSGVVVDHRSGDVFINLSDVGMFRSADQGDTWMRTATALLKGRTESPGCLMIDPSGGTKMLLTALVYGAPASTSDDKAATFRHMAKRAEHIDWCAVDWTDPARRFVLALKHEMGGLLIASNDGGTSFREVGKHFISGWVFDSKTAVVAMEKSETHPEPTLQRTTDGGDTFTSCGSYSPVNGHSSRALPKWHDGKLYWLTHKGLIASSDKGATWQVVATIDKAAYGPIFGKDKSHLFVLTRDGIVESKDGGKTWADPIPGPDGLIGHGELTWLEYDPLRDILYLTRMGRDLYRLKRR